LNEFTNPIPVRLRTIVRLICATAAVVAAACGGNAVVNNPPPPAATFPPPSLFNVTLVSTDPFSNATSQHATEVEPSMSAAGTTIVATFQTGRFFVAGASDIGFATSQDGGASWVSGFLPGMTHYSVPSGSFDSVSDPVIAYDAAHGEWLLSSLPVFFLSTTLVPGALVNRSTDGIHWSVPVAVAPGQPNSDKDWIACDNTLASPFYGHCYVQWDDPNSGVIHVSISTDGGQTWSVPVNTGGNATGIAGQPMVQPNETVIIPIDDFFEANVLAFASHDGGVTWSAPVSVSPIIVHFDAGGLRSNPLPSAAMDAAGNAYVVWQDCRFRVKCSANDLVMSTSADGIGWTAPARVPIDPTTSLVDHFIPGVAVAPGTSGSTAHLGITFYYYANTNCSGTAPCRLSVAYITSHDGGTSWSAPTQIVGPMSTSWLAGTDQGSMVGDYIATAFVGTQPFGIFAVALPPAPGFFHEAMYASRLGFLPARALERASSPAERPVPGAHSDRMRRLRPP